MMTAIEQTANANMMMSTTTPSLLESTHSSLLNVLPSRPSLMEKKGSSPSTASPKSLIDAKLNLLMVSDLKNFSPCLFVSLIFCDRNWLSECVSWIKFQ